MQILINNIKKEKYEEKLENKNFLNNQNYVLKRKTYFNFIFIKGEKIENLYNHNYYNTINISNLLFILGLILLIVLLLIFTNLLLIFFIFIENNSYINIINMFIIFLFYYLFNIFTSYLREETELLNYYLFNKNFYNIFLYKKDKFVILKTRRKSYSIFPEYFRFK